MNTYVVKRNKKTQCKLNRRSRVPRSWFLTALFDDQKHLCYLCGRQMTLTRNQTNTATIDHVQPRSTLPKEEANKRSNQKAACLSCNEEKGNLSAAEYLALKRRTKAMT